MKTKSLVTLGILLPLLALSAWATGKKESQTVLQKEAKITMEQAQKAALAREPGKIQEKELEREKGRLIYSFDIRMKDGIHEVNVDAMTGEIVEDTVEDAAAEAREKAADNKQKQEKTPPQNY